MKKIYLSFASLALASTSFAQINSANYPQAEGDFSPQKSDKTVEVAPVYEFEKAAGDVIYSTQFNGNLDSWVGSGANAGVWMFDLDGPNGPFSNPAAQKILSTTNANGFAIFDADLFNATAPYVNLVGNLESPVIDLSTFSNVVISFEHSYRTCCDNAFKPVVQVSTDNFTTFTEFDVTPFGAGVNVFVPRTLRKIDLTSYLATATNLTNFKMRFRFDGTGGSSHYFWQIDDVTVRESFDNDLAIRLKNRAIGTFELDYYSLPINQQSPVTFSSNVQNFGQLPQSNTVLSVTIDNGGGTVSSPGVTIAAGTSDSLVTTAFTPAAVAPLVYNTAFSITATNPDDAISDNTSTDVLNITQYRFAVDNGTPVGVISNFSSNSTMAFKIGNIMEVLNDDKIFEMSMVISTAATNVGQDVYGEVYRFDATASDYFLIGTTGLLTITSGNNGTTLTIPTTTNIPVFTGDELLVMACHFGGGGTADVQFRSAQPALPNTVLGYDASDALFGLSNPRVPMVRVNMNPTASLEESLSSDIVATVSPNPTAGKSVLNYVLTNSSDVQITIYDVSGKIVSTENFAGQNSGAHKLTLDLSTYNDGLYYVNLTTNEGQVTRKVVKK